MDNFAQIVLKSMAEFKTLPNHERHRYKHNSNTQISFMIGNREIDEVDYAFSKTNNFIHNLANLLEEMYNNPESNNIESSAHQILQYDKPFDFKSEPYFTLSPNGNQLRFWIGPYSHASYDHVDSSGANIIFSVRQSSSVHDFVYRFCSSHSILIPKYYE
jgi:hypothetical protein